MGPIDRSDANSIGAGRLFVGKLRGVCLAESAAHSAGWHAEQTTEYVASIGAASSQSGRCSSQLRRFDLVFLVSFAKMQLP